MIQMYSNCLWCRRIALFFLLQLVLCNALKCSFLPSILHQKPRRLVTYRCIYPNCRKFFLVFHLLATQSDEDDFLSKSSDGDDPSLVFQRHIDNLERNLDEKFVKGTGNGGQKINKTSNRVVLTHIPTGIRVSCQDARDLSTNRKWARDMLRDKLEEFYLGEKSKIGKQIVKEKKRKINAERKSKKRAKARLEESKYISSSTTGEILVKDKNIEGENAGNIYDEEDIERQRLVAETLAIMRDRKLAK